MTLSWQELWERDRARWSVLLVVAVALATSVSGLGNGFVYDDVPVLVENPMVTQLHGLTEYLTASYWGPSRGSSLYRPLTVIVYALEWVVGGGKPWLYHLVNVALYAMTAVVVLRLARELLPAGAALVAGLLWAAHPVHVEAVGNIVGQSELLTALPMLLAVTAFVHDRRAGALRRSTVALVALLFACALLTKEHGIVLPALLVLAEVSLRTEGTAPDREVRRRLWLLARVLALMVICYVVVRLAVLGGFVGDAPHPALEGLTRGQRAWVMLGLVPEFVRLFWWPARLYADYSPQSVLLLTAPDPRHLVGAAWLVLFGALLVWGWRRDRIVAFALLWIALTLGPVSNILVATGVLVAERTLFLPSVGIALLVGRAVAILWPRLLTVPARWVRIAVPGVAGVVLVSAVALSADRQLVWEDNPTLFATMVVDAPQNYKAHHALGELFGSAGAWARAEPELRLANSLLPGYDLLELSLARMLHFDDRCPEALPLYESVLSHRADAEVAAIGRAACLLETRRLTAAREESIRGIGRGLSVGPFGMLLQKAESSLVATDTVDARNRWWRAGAPFSRSNARLKVPVLMMRSGTISRRRMPESLPDSASRPGRDQ